MDEMLDAHEPYDQSENKRKCRRACFNVQRLGLLNIIFLTMTDNRTSLGRSEVAIPIHVVTIRQSEYELIAKWPDSDDWSCVGRSTAAAHMAYDRNRAKRITCKPERDPVEDSLIKEPHLV